MQRTFTKSDLTLQIHEGLGKEQVASPVDPLGNCAGGGPGRLTEHLRGDVHWNGTETDGEGNDVNDDTYDRNHRHRVTDGIIIGDRLTSHIQGF